MINEELALQKIKQTLNISEADAKKMLSQVPELTSMEALSSVTEINTTQLQGLLSQTDSLFDDAFQGLLSLDSPMAPGFSNEIIEKVEQIIARGKAIADTAEDLLKENFKNFDDFSEDILKNPMEKILGSIGGQLDEYESLTYIADVYEAFKNVILNLINEVVVQTVISLIREISILIEGTAKADFANAKGATEQIFNPNSLQELSTSENLKDDVFDIVSTFPTYEAEITSITEDQTTSITEDQIRKDLSDFLDNMSEILTTSEICSLFSDPAVDSIPYDIAFDKLWYGLLSLEKYEKLKKVINRKDKLKRVLDSISDNFDQVMCREKVENLTKTKKLLSELCAPNSSDDFANSLKSGLTKEAIAKVLEQENTIIDELLNSMNKINMSDLGLSDRPLFCGPEAKQTGKEPYFNTTQHDSLTHLNKKELDSVFRSTQINFEAEVSKFKTIMTDPIFNVVGSKDNLASSFAGAFNAASQARNVMQFVYKQPEGGYNEDNVPPIAAELQNLVNQYKVIAKRVSDQLNDLQSDNIDVQVFEESSVIKISITPAGNLTDDYLFLFMNFGNDVYSPDEFNVAANTSKIFFKSSDDGLPATYQTNLGGTMPFGESGVFADNSANQFGNDDYDLSIKNLVQSSRFYGVVLEQIIKEHAEYITTQDLFKKENFNRLELRKNTVCDENSLFFYKDMLNSFSDLAEKIECVVGFSSTPSPMEMAKIYLIFEGYVRVLTVNEMMKSFFVFASFGVAALMPQSNETSDNNSFYFEYLAQQIRKKIVADRLLTVDGSLQKILKTVYYAKNINKGVESAESVAIAQVLTFFAAESAKKVQSVVKTKLELAGFNSKNIKQGGTFGALQEEFSLFKTVDGTVTSTNTLQNQQKLSNILAHDIDKVQYLDPPTVVDVKFDEKYVVIPAGYYSNYPGIGGRLTNGGFFIEKGLEVEHAYGDESVFTQDLYNNIYENLDGSTFQALFQSAVLTDDLLASFLFGGIRIKKAYVPNTGYTPAYKIDQNFETYKYNDNLSLNLDSFFKDTLAVNQSLTSFFNREGSLPVNGTAYSLYKQLFGAFAGFTNQVVTGLNGYYQDLNDVAYVGPNAASRIAQLLNPANNYFKKFQYYTSLNVLIPVDEIEQDNFIETLNLDFSEDLESRNAFIKAALEKKYFIREENGRKYFKLPIIKLVNANQTLPLFVQDLFNEIQTVVSIFEGNTDLAKTQIRNEFANSSEFKNLMNSMDYKSLLSFVAILITEVVQQKYPDIDAMFNKAKKPLKASIKYSLKRANRFSDATPDSLYKQDLSSRASFTVPDAAIDFSVVYELLSAIIKATANFMDPLWRTPWFLPGPSQSIGITAKILEAVEDIDFGEGEDAGQKAYDAANPASNENNIKLKRAMGLAEDDQEGSDKCEGYLAGSDNVSNSKLVSPLES